MFDAKEYAKKYGQEYYLKNKEEIQAYQKEYHKINRVKNKSRFKNNELKRKFGITLDQYNQMVLDQNNLCAICNKFETRNDPRTNSPMSLAVDHDHATGKVRGLLCNCCNYGLGLFEDLSSRLRIAAEYLEKHKLINTEPADSGK